MSMNLSNIFDAKAMMSRLFRPVENVVWDMTTGKIGISTKQGIATVEGEGDEASVSINTIEQFGMPIPAFASNTPFDTVKNGDVIFTNEADSSVGWVIKKTGKTLTILRPNGSFSRWNPPKLNMIFGPESGIMVLRSLDSMLPGGTTGVNGLSGMLMPMMIMSGGELDFESIMPMMLMSQMGTVTTVTTDAEGNQVPVPQSVPFGNMSQMMPMMMMMSALKKDSGESRGGQSYTAKKQDGLDALRKGSFFGNQDRK